jgi:hypothetical protein
MSVQRAIDAAFNGPEVKKLKIFDHEFNIKPMEIIREGDSETARGHISHHLSFRPDDQVYFTIDKVREVITRIDVKINRGGYTSIIAPIASALGTYFTGVPIPPDKVEEVGRSLGTVIDGRWDSVAHYLIAEFALRL